MAIKTRAMMSFHTFEYLVITLWFVGRDIARFTWLFSGVGYDSSPNHRVSLV